MAGTVGGATGEPRAGDQSQDGRGARGHALRQELRGDVRVPPDAEAELGAADQPEPGPLLPHLDGQEDEGVDGGDSETRHGGTG